MSKASSSFVLAAFLLVLSVQTFASIECEETFAAPQTQSQAEAYKLKGLDRLADLSFPVETAYNADSMVATIFRDVPENAPSNGKALMFVSANFRFVKSRELKKEIIQYFLEKFNKSGNFSDIHYFVSRNKGLAELESLPIALATDEDLNAFARSTRGITYQNWASLGWVESANADGRYKESFYEVAYQTSQIHFEIGRIFKNPRRLKSALLTIEREGDEKFLERISRRLKSLIKFGRRGYLTITNLELYWVLRNPEFFNKTIFYVDQKALTAEERDHLFAKLKGEI